jgi:hypothetical protein
MDEKKKPETSWEERTQLGPYQLEWRLGLALAGTAVVCTLFFALVRVASVSQMSSGPEPVASTPPVPMSQEESTVGGNPDQPTHGGALPREPFKGQKRPPRTRYAKVELVGACWLPHERKAPCPDVLYEYQGKCYSPAFSARPPPQSLGP